MTRHATHPPSRSVPSRAPDARTLYLAAAQPLRVTSTGEALVVHRADGEVWRLPVARLLRIVCCSLQIDWSGAALALCLQRRITVTWLDQEGDAIGHLWPPRAEPPELDTALERLAAEHPQWPVQYGHWLRQRRLVILKGWAQQRGAAGQPVAAPEWEQAKRRVVYLAEIGQVLPPCLGGMAAALAVMLMLGLAVIMLGARMLARVALGMAA